MGTQTIVFGYIELPGNSVPHVEDALDGFDFDEIFPFRRIFSGPVRGYRSSMVSFADNLKANESEWGEWVSRFEDLLLQMDAVSAKVHIEDDESQARLCFSYLKSGGNWLRWRIKSEEKETDEMIL